jgi:RNA polymerase sigma-70 factor, ECF subfamily
MASGGTESRFALRPKPASNPAVDDIRFDPGLKLTTGALRPSRDTDVRNDEPLAAVFEAHRAEVYRIARAVTGDREAALDAVQETFLKIHRSFESFKGACSLRTWIVRIAIRAAIDQKRRAYRHTKARQLDEDPTHDPRGRMDDAVALQQVQQLAERLPGQQGLILRLRLLSGLSNTEIALSLGLREPNVRMQLTKAVRRLREML